MPELELEHHNLRNTVEFNPRLKRVKIIEGFPAKIYYSKFTITVLLRQSTATLWRIILLEVFFEWYCTV
jgi:hypothetical protein